MIHTHPKQEDRAISNLEVLGAATFNPKIRERRYNQFLIAPTYILIGTTTSIITALWGYSLRRLSIMAKRPLCSKNASAFWMPLSSLLLESKFFTEGSQSYWHIPKCLLYSPWKFLSRSLRRGLRVESRDVIWKRGMAILGALFKPLLTPFLDSAIVPWSLMLEIGLSSVWVAVILQLNSTHQWNSDNPDLIRYLPR